MNSDFPNTELLKGKNVMSFPAEYICQASGTPWWLILDPNDYLICSLVWKFKNWTTLDEFIDEYELTRLEILEARKGKRSRVTTSPHSQSSNPGWKERL